MLAVGRLWVDRLFYNLILLCFKLLNSFLFQFFESWKTLCSWLDETEVKLQKLPIGVKTKQNLDEIKVIAKLFLKQENENKITMYKLL